MFTIEVIERGHRRSQSHQPENGPPIPGSDAPCSLLAGCAGGDRSLLARVGHVPATLDCCDVHPFLPPSTALPIGTLRNHLPPGRAVAILRKPRGGAFPARRGASTEQEKFI